MFKISEERSLEISGKVIKNEEYKTATKEQNKLQRYIETELKGNKAILEAFERYEELNCEIITVCEEAYYREGLKDGMGLYKD